MISYDTYGTYDTYDHFFSLTSCLHSCTVQNDAGAPSSEHALELRCALAQLTHMQPLAKAADTATRRLTSLFVDSGSVPRKPYNDTLSGWPFKTSFRHAFINGARSETIMHNRTKYEKANYTECEKARCCAMYDNKLSDSAGSNQISDHLL